MKTVLGVLVVLFSGCGFGDVTMTAPESVIVGSIFEVELKNGSGGSISYNCCFIRFSSMDDGGPIDDRVCTSEAHTLANGASWICPVAAPTVPGQYSLVAEVSSNAWHMGVGVPLEVTAQ